MTTAIQTQSLTKAFPATQGWRSLLPGSQVSRRPAVDQVTLQVNQGELFGLIGPNGAGKTTLVKILATLIIPTSGSALVNGYDLNHDTAIKQSIGLVTSDERSFYWRLTGRHNLEFFATLSGLPPAIAKQRIAEVSEQIGLQEFIDSRFLTYSTGMRQRISIARALLNHPRLLFLDEPTKGLDWAATQALYTLIREQLANQQGITILLTTHSLNDVERLCDRVAVMHRGHIRGCGTVSELRSQLGMAGRHTLQMRHWSPKLQAQIEGLQKTIISPNADQTTQVEFDTPAQETLHTVLENIQEQGGRILDISHQEASLETIFDHLTQQKDVPPAAPAAAQNQPALVAKPAPARQFDPRHTARVIAAFIRRDYSEEISYRFSFFFQFFSIFVSVLAFYFIANLIGPAALPYLSDYRGDYFGFVLIGLALSGYFGTGLSSFTSSLRQAQTTGTLEAMLTTPTSLSTIIFASSLWNYLMTTFRALIYLGIGGFLLGVDLSKANILTTLILLTLTVISFSSLGVIAASFIMVIKRGEPVTWIFNSVAGLLGGVYYPIAILPAWLQFFAWLIPVTYALEGLRQALLNGATILDLGTQTLALVIFSAVLLPISLVGFNIAVRRARRDGSLTHY